MNVPTADDVAHAIVAACRETGEDPIACASRMMGVKARHYALAALCLVFRDAQKRDLAEMCGCPKKGSYFVKNSICQVVGRAAWWDRTALARVLQHVKDHRSPAPLASTAPASSSKPGRQLVVQGLRRRTRATIAREIDARVAATAKSQRRLAAASRAVTQDEKQRWRDEQGQGHAAPSQAGIVHDEGLGRDRLSARIDGAHVSLSPPPKPNAFTLGPSRRIED